MTPDQIDLARRLVACPRWRWVPEKRWVQVRAAPLDTIIGRIQDRRPRDGMDVPNGAVPDLTDPATAGCLLAMLVAVDPGAGWGVSCGPDVGWRATSCAHDLSGATCGEALARALLVVWEAAP
jgi:hypothetical protein